jgi:AcrR family transcriptional regulator
MSGSDGEPTDTKTAIMEATYRALCEHGYADLTIQDIADEFEKSRSLLFYHYDTKEELLVDFLRFLLDWFADDLSANADASPPEQLRGLLERTLPAELDDEGEDFQVAFLELRSQAPYIDEFREQFTRTDEFLYDTIAAYIEAGIEEDAFREVDVDETAAVLVGLVYGTIFIRVSTDDDAFASSLREGVLGYVHRLEA